MGTLYSIVKILLRIHSRLIALTGIMQLILEHHQVGSHVPIQVNWLDNQDVMQKLNISPSTLKRRRLEGVIPCTRIKGKFYYRESDIQALLARGMGR